MDIPDLTSYLEDYRFLEHKLETLTDQDDPADLLIAFPLASYNGNDAKDIPLGRTVSISYNELTALCPWTRFPDQGSIEIRYLPNKLILELKSAKYYFLSFRERHITQEHLCQKIYEDFWNLLAPLRLEVVLDYLPRGGLHTVVTLDSFTE